MNEDINFKSNIIFIYLNFIDKHVNLIFFSFTSTSYKKFNLSIEYD